MSPSYKRHVDKADETTTKTRFNELSAVPAFPGPKFCFEPHGAYTLVGQSQRNVCELNLRPDGQLPFFTSSWLLQWKNSEQPLS